MATYLSVIQVADAGGLGFTLALERPDPQEIRVGLESLREWFRPSRRLSRPQVLVFVAGAILLYLQLRRPTNRSVEDQPGLPHLPGLLAAFVVVYTAVLLASLSLLGEYLPLEERYLVPLYVAAVALGACHVTRLVGQAGRLREPLLAAAAVSITAVPVGGSTALATGTYDYPGFTARPWRESQAMREVGALPASTRIYSNWPEAIYITTGREARLLPKERVAADPNGRRRQARMTRLADDVRTGDAVVVFFTITQRDLLPTPKELFSVLGVPPRVDLADALVYQAGGA